MSEMALFDDDDKYTTTANELQERAVSHLKPLMLSYAKMGYSVREVAHILQHAVSDCESMVMLTPPDER